MNPLKKTLNKKNMALLSLNKIYDKKSKQFVNLQNKMKEAEELLNDIVIEQNDLYSKKNELQSSMDVLRKSCTRNDAIKLFKVIEQIETEQK